MNAAIDTTPDHLSNEDALRDPSLYLNRELSQLDFNFRVLAQALDPQVPLLERLRFLCISCTNLDEFFEIRAATVRPAVRLEIAQDCPKPIIRTLLQNFALPDNAVYLIDGPVNLNRVIQVYDLVQRPELKYPVFTPRTLRDSDAIFDKVDDGDVLLHHPFDAFTPVLELLKQAAVDPNVLAIKQTLYRTGKDSAIVDALVQAARNGKDVTVVVELRARFDEDANLGVADRLQEAGAQVVYGVVGYKTHAKMLLIVRREGKKLRRYVHLGTGN